MTFGRLTVIERLPERTKERRAQWRCQCSCGNETIVPTKYLTTGATRSCGCYRREQHLEIFTKHNESKTKLYYVWNDIKTRCYNQNSVPYKDYGGRGIKMCDEWRESFTSFKEWALGSGYKEGLSIDRIDVNAGYYPDNCRWTDVFGQANNKRSNRKVEYNGETHTISEWARIFDIDKTTLRQRLDLGWSVADAMSIRPKPGGYYGDRRSH